MASRHFRAELPDLTGLKRGLPEIDLRIGIATGDIVVGSIGGTGTPTRSFLRR